MGNKPRNISIILLLLTAMLPAQDITLGNIEIISTNKTKQKATKTTADIDVITSEDIRQNGYISIVDALSNSLGINISQNGGVGQKSSFFLRGMDSGKSWFLLME